MSHDSYHELNESWLISRTQWVMTHITNSMSHDSYHTISWHAILDSVVMTHITNSTSHVFNRVCDMTHSYVWQDSYHELPTHCNTLQHTATHCNTLQHIAAHCSTLQHTATLCNTLQHTATHYNTLQYTAAHCNTLQHTAAHCSTLQHTATHCNTLQHSATLCNTLQHVAHAKEPCRAYHSVMSHTHRGVMSHIRMSHVSAESIGRRHAHSQQWSWHDSFICMTWLISQTQRVMSPQSLSAGDMVTVSNYRDMTQITNSTSHVFNRVCDMTHSYVWHDSFICVTWLIHMCDMTHIANSTSHVSAESISGRHSHSQQLSWHDSNHELNESCLCRVYRRSTWSQSATAS